MITFQDFCLARRILSVPEYIREFSDPGAWDHFDEGQKRALQILTYPGGYYIEDVSDVREGMKYYLILERSEFESDDLADLESKLYEYAATEGLEDVKPEDLPHMKASALAMDIWRAMNALCDLYRHENHVQAVIDKAGEANVIQMSLDELAAEWAEIADKLAGGKA